MDDSIELLRQYYKIFSGEDESQDIILGDFVVLKHHPMVETDHPFMSKDAKDTNYYGWVVDFVLDDKTNTMRKKLGKKLDIKVAVLKDNKISTYITDRRLLCKSPIKPPFNKLLCYSEAQLLPCVIPGQIIRLRPYSSFPENNYRNSSEMYRGDLIVLGCDNNIVRVATRNGTDIITNKIFISELCASPNC